MVMPISKAFTTLKTRLEWVKLDPRFRLLAKLPLPPVDPREEKETTEYLNYLIMSIEKQRQKEILTIHNWNF